MVYESKDVKEDFVCKVQCIVGVSEKCVETLYKTQKYLKDNNANEDEFKSDIAQWLYFNGITSIESDVTEHYRTIKEIYEVTCS